MGEWSARWSLWSVLVAVQHVGGCNVREIAEIVQKRFREEIAAQCASIGDKCSFDRECCKGLECLMSATHDGIGLSCQRAWLADPDRGDMVFEMPDSSPSEPKSEDVDWMAFKSEEVKGNEDHLKSMEDTVEKMYPTDMMTEIENLREKKKMKLLQENYELEKLFTEREEQELEQLRALRADAEIDQLRRLKELRLKRKMQLIKELKELRGLRAEEDYNALQEFKKSKNLNESINTLSTQNETDVIDENDNNLNPNSVAEYQTQSPDKVPDTQEGQNLPKHKQGIHEVHHKRKHHHHKKKNQGQTLDPSNQTEDANAEDETFTEFTTQDE